MTSEATGHGETWYRALLDASVQGIVAIDAEGIVHNFSHGAELMFGYTADEVVGQNVSMLMPSPYREAHDSYLRAYVRTGENHVVGRTREVRVLHADGTTFPISLSVGETRIDDKSMFIGIMVDHRERDEARYWLDEFFDLALELLAIATFDGTFVRLNPTWETVLGYPMEEMLHIPFLDFVHPDDVEATVTLMAALAEGRQVIGFENRYRRSDGTYIWLEWSVKPMLDRGLQMAVARDVTHRHDVERGLQEARNEADRANHAKSDFLSRMSHELRTPLNSVIGFAQLLEMDELNEEQAEYVTFIQRSGRHLLELINEVLDIAQIEAGHLHLSLEPVAVADELRTAMDLIRLQAANKGITLTTECVDDFMVLADRQRLLQVLLNLLSNAVKYNRPDGFIAVRCDRVDGNVVISVADTGIGINAANFDALFTPFERLGAEHTDAEGTGVGLALSRALSEQMGGTVTVESIVGTGSTFFLTLPAAEPLTLDDEAPAEKAVGEPPSGQLPLSVLYIEDNVANARLMERALAKGENIELVTTIQGSLGVDLAAQLRPELVLLDLHLPDMHGEEVLQRLRANPDLANTKVVVCSADASPSQVSRLLERGADAYLTKPIDLPELFGVIARVRSGEPLRTPKPKATP